jgi:hypothetical protein
MIDVDQTNGRIGIPVRFSGWPRDKMTCQVSQVTASVHEPHPGTLLMSVSTSSPPTSIATTSDGRKMLSFPADSLRALFSQTVDLQVSIDLMVYQSRERVDIALERGWIRLPEFGNVRFLEDVHGRRLVWRAALDPGRPGWSYDLGDDQSEFVTNGQWAWSGSAPASPIWFPTSPVYSYAGSSWIPYSGVTVVHGDEGTSAYRQPGELIFTAKRLVDTVPRRLNISNLSLTGQAAASQPPPSGQCAHPPSHGTRTTTR